MSGQLIHNIDDLEHWLNEPLIVSESIDKDIYEVASKAILNGSYKFMHAESFLYHVNKEKNAAVKQIYDRCSDKIIQKVKYIAKENDSSIVIMNVLYSSKGLHIDLNHFSHNQ